MKGQGFSMKKNGIFGFIFLVLILVALFFISKGIFKLLALAAPVLIIGALIINYRTVINYFKFVLSLVQRSPLAGILVILLSIVGFPILSGVLFAKALFDRRIRRLHQAHELQRRGEYVEFEEVAPRNERNELDLPPLEKHEQKKADNRYEDLF